MKKHGYHRQYAKRQIGRELGFIALVVLLVCAVGLIAARVQEDEQKSSAGGFLGVDAFASGLSTQSGDEIEITVPELSAANVCVLSAETNTLIYQKNGDEQIAPASTAKLLTALTVTEYCRLDETVTVGRELELVAPDSSTAWLAYGDTLTVRQLLAALLLPSGNDAAYTLASYTGRIIGEDSGLSEEAAIDIFVNEMNNKAEAYGAVSSSFKNADGYDAPGQYTTAFDLAQIGRAFLENAELMAIAGSHAIYETMPDGRELNYTNTNALLDPGSPYYYAGAVGLKTGYTSQAGACLVSAALIGGRSYLCVVMGAGEESRFLDTLAIYEAISA